MAIQRQQEAAEETRQKAEKELEAKRASAVRFGVRIIQVQRNGILADKMTKDFFSTGETIFVEMPTSGLVDDRRMKLTAYRDGTISYSNTLGAQRTVEKWVYVP